MELLEAAAPVPAEMKTPAEMGSGDANEPEI
jgi:hypothetical protein